MQSVLPPGFRLSFVRESVTLAIYLLRNLHELLHILRVTVPKLHHDVTLSVGLVKHLA